MKFIFWTSVYDGNIKYLQANTMLQEISKTQEIYFMASGNECKDVIKKLYNGHIVDCQNDMAVKGDELFKILKNRDDYDILIRTDIDAIIFKEEQLRALIEESIPEGSHCVMGNRRKFTGKKFKRMYYGVQYVRGPCTATTRSVIDQIDMITNRKAGFDIPYAISAKKTGCEFVKRKLYETSSSYKGVLPAWHLHIGGEKKWQAFQRELKRGKV